MDFHTYLVSCGRGGGKIWGVWGQELGDFLVSCFLVFFFVRLGGECNVLCWILLVKDAQKRLRMQNAMHLDLVVAFATTIRSTPLTLAP